MKILHSPANPITYVGYGYVKQLSSKTKLFKLSLLAFSLYEHNITSISIVWAVTSFHFNVFLKKV